MKNIKKKAVVLSALASIAIASTGISVAYAIHYEGIGNDDCINDWHYAISVSDPYSNYYNDDHRHYSYVTISGTNYYSSGINGSYYVEAGDWAYATHSRKWYQSNDASWHNINGCHANMFPAND